MFGFDLGVIAWSVEWRTFYHRAHLAFYDGGGKLYFQDGRATARGDNFLAEMFALPTTRCLIVEKLVA